MLGIVKIEKLIKFFRVLKIIYNLDENFAINFVYGRKH